MNPIVEYVNAVLKYGADRRYYARSLLYFVKFLPWEPFRLGERVVARARGEKQEIPKPPLFLLGYYRSGTSHLQDTLLCDPQLGYMNFYQCFFPAAFTSTERWVKPVFERIVRRMGMLHPAHGIPFSFELPAEEDVSMVASGFRLAANWGQTVPKHFKEIYERSCLMETITEDELAEWKRELHDLLYRVSKANGHKRLLLKSPPQLSRLAILREMYPGAKFLFIRRNPYDVFASNKKLWKSFEKTWLQDVDADAVREYILWSFDRCHRAYERDKRALGKNELVEMSFEDFRRAPMATMRRIYDVLELGDFADVKDRFAAYLDRTHEASQPPYHLTEEERRAVDARLGRWIRAWGYDQAPTVDA